ncbi:hypothetical protein [Alistipes ihumii]|jgi:hypothetical protein|uniref:hypothetical protein n=1 Tax=Alistipes ihumii TaxID=1470347 RepID=UPI0023532571|nr:hypothetical protein [Alistipes ihumii]
MAIFKDKADGHKQGFDEKGDYCLFLIIKTTMLLMLSNPSLQATLVQNGKRTASRFSMEKSMRQFIDVIS